MKKNKRFSFKIVILAVSIVTLTAVSPAIAAVIIQNSVSNTVGVETSPINVLPGADDSTSFVNVVTGTFSNEDDADSIGSNTLLASNAITFTCFAGERTLLTDVIQVENASTSNWNIGYSILPTSLTDTFGDGGDSVAGGDADIYIYHSATDSATPFATNPITTPGDWNADFAQLEVVSNTLQVTGNATTDVIAPQTVAAGERRQIALVIDCGVNLTDEATDGGTGEFVLNIEATPI